RQELRQIWVTAAKWDNIPPDSKFVMFSNENPFLGEYNRLSSEISRLHGQLEELAKGEVPAHGSLHVKMFQEGKKLKREGKQWWEYPNWQQLKRIEQDWLQAGWHGLKSLDDLNEYRQRRKARVLEGDIEAYREVEAESGAMLKPGKELESRTLWDRAMALLKKNRKKADTYDRLFIYELGSDIEPQLAIQMNKDLDAYPLFDALAMWVQPVDNALTAYDPRIHRIAEVIIRQYELDLRASTIPRLAAMMPATAKPRGWTFPEDRPERVPQEPHSTNLPGSLTPINPPPQEPPPFQREYMAGQKPLKDCVMQPDGTCSLIGDSPEYIAQTIARDGLMEKMDEVFPDLIAKSRGK
ncbi:MAG: hypothetical protein ABIF09_17405, partial [Gemmatimonadota bacterium]